MRMIGVRKTVFIILVLALAGFAAYKIKGKMDRARILAQQGAQQGNQTQWAVPVVKVLPLAPRRIEETLSLTGEIKAGVEIAVQPRINGRLRELLVGEGQMVRVGQPVAILDDETLRLQIQQSEASMAVIQANLRQAELTVARAEADLERYRELLALRYISQREYDANEAAYLNALASLEGYRSQLAAAQKNHEILQIQLGYTKVYSPAAGIVLKKEATVGMNLTTGTTIVTIAPLDPIDLVFYVDQKEAARIRRGMRVKFSTDAFPNDVFTGTITGVAPTFDPKTRTLSLVVRLNNPQGRLVPGIFGTAEILIGAKEKALVVPQEAIVTQEGRIGVFVVDPTERAKFVPVTTGLSAQGQVEILSGLRPGDLVVVIGQNRLRDGQTVKITGDGDRPESGAGTSQNPGGRKAGEGR